MQPGGSYRCVLVTAPTLTAARKMASGALNARLAACANLVPKIESHYWWQGRLESSAEVLIIFKTCQSQLEALEKFILQSHSYDTPEFLVLPIEAGAEKYLKWIGDSVAAPAK